MKLDITRGRAAKWYLVITLTLTAISATLHGALAPPTGLLRTFYSDSGFAGEPLLQDRTTEVSLAFLDRDPTLPRRFFSVEWSGYWFIRQATTVALYAGGDDRIDVLVDGQRVVSGTTGAPWARHERSAISAVSVAGSQLFIVLQLFVLILSIFTQDRETHDGPPGWSLPPAEIYQLSRDRNVIHVVLDAFLSETFAEFIEEERSAVDRDFSGFIFFADHLGGFPTTRASMPAMLTGIAYRNEMPLDDLIRENIRDRSIFSVLAAQGYEINSVTFHRQELYRTRFLGHTFALRGMA